jgi:hypothetical protein
VTLPEAVLRARLLNGDEQLGFVASANPGHVAQVEAYVVHDRTRGLWIVLPDDARRLDDTLWASFHVDPDEELLGRVRVTIEAIPA